MLFRKLALLSLLSLLLFACVSGEKKEPKTVEQLNEEGQLLGRMLTYFMDNNFDFQKIEDLAALEHHEESYSVDGPDGGSAKIVIKSKTRVEDKIKLYNFDFEVTFKDYSYEGLTLKSGSCNFTAVLNITFDEEGKENLTALSMALLGEVEYRGTASGSAELKLASKLTYDSNSALPSSEEEDYFLIIDGTEVDTKDIEFFN